MDADDKARISEDLCSYSVVRCQDVAKFVALNIDFPIVNCTTDDLPPIYSANLNFQTFSQRSSYTASESLSLR